MILDVLLKTGSDLMPGRRQGECARQLYGLTPVAGSEPLRRRSFHGFPALWQHIECQRVTVGVLIAFQYGHRR